MPKFKLKAKKDDKWTFLGMYPDKFIEQLCAAVESLVKAGFEMYKSIRVERVDDDAGHP